MCQAVDLDLRRVPLDEGRRNDGYSKTVGKKRWHHLDSHHKNYPKISEDTSAPISSMQNEPLGMWLLYWDHHQSAHHHVYILRISDDSDRLLHTIAEQEEQRNSEKSLQCGVDVSFRFFLRPADWCIRGHNPQLQNQQERPIHQHLKVMIAKKKFW